MKNLYSASVAEGEIKKGNILFQWPNYAYLFEKFILTLLFSMNPSMAMAR